MHLISSRSGCDSLDREVIACYLLFSLLARCFDNHFDPWPERIRSARHYYLPVRACLWVCMRVSFNRNGISSGFLPEPVARRPVSTDTSKKDHSGGGKWQWAGALYPLAIRMHGIRSESWPTGPYSTRNGNTVTRNNYPERTLVIVALTTMLHFPLSVFIRIFHPLTLYPLLGRRFLSRDLFQSSNFQPFPFQRSAKVRLRRFLSSVVFVRCASE